MVAMKKKRPCEETVDLAPEEQERRRLQRQRQKIAYAMREQGQDYVKSVKRVKSNTATDAKDKAARASRGAGPTSPPVQVAIIAIFWNQRPKEKKMVLDKCEEVKQKLHSESFSVCVDSNSKFTPGQRMRYWEEKGVKVRIELGPKDAEQNTCIVARCQAIPGKVAFKRTSEIGTEMCDVVNQMLHMCEEDVPEGKIEKQCARIQDTAPQKPKLSTSKPVRSLPEAAIRGAGGGDDLEDDFVAISYDV